MWFRSDHHRADRVLGIVQKRKLKTKKWPGEFSTSVLSNLQQSDLWALMSGQ